MQPAPVLKSPYPGLREVVCTDHEFAAWLREHGWKGEYHHVAHSTHYHGAAQGETIALTLVDNEKCTRRVFLKEGV